MQMEKYRNTLLARFLVFFMVKSTLHVFFNEMFNLGMFLVNLGFTSCRTSLQRIPSVCLTYGTGMCITMLWESAHLYVHLEEKCKFKHRSSDRPASQNVLVWPPDCTLAGWMFWQRRFAIFVHKISKRDDWEGLFFSIDCILDLHFTFFMILFVFLYGNGDTTL